jgi:hypothetical protein
MTYYKCLKPINLYFMQCSTCFYCRTKSDSTIIYSLDDEMGIPACKTHADFARRDIRADMHRKKTVMQHHAMHNEKFITLNTLLGCNIKVKRSNGAIDDGWCIMNRLGDYWKIYQQEGLWYITVTKDYILQKEMALQDLFETHDDVAIHSLVTECIELLNQGMYVDSYNEQIEYMAKKKEHDDMQETIQQIVDEAIQSVTNNTDSTTDEPSSKKRKFINEKPDE